MEPNTLRESLRLDTPVRRMQTQILVEGDVIVPDYKPDVAALLHERGRVRLNQERVAAGKVSFDGVLDVTLLYRPVSGGWAAALTGSLPFSDYLADEDLTGGETTRVTAELAHLECRLLNDRKIGVRAVVTVWVEVTGQQTVERMVDGEGLEGLPGTLTASRQTVEKVEYIPVKVQLEAAESQPEIGSLLDWEVQIADRETRPQEGRVSLSGTLRVQVLYSSAGETPSLEMLEGEFPFGGVLEEGSLQAGAPTAVQLTLEDVALRTETDENGEERLVEGEVLLRAVLRQWETWEVPYWQDAYSLTEPLEPIREEVVWPAFVGQTESRVLVRDTVVLPAGTPDVLRVLWVWNALSLDEPETGEGRVTVEGSANFQLLYMAANDGEPLRVEWLGLPFRQEVQMAGVEPGMQAEVWGEIEGFSCQLTGPREIECRATVRLDLRVLSENRASILTGMQPGRAEQEPLTANLVLYVVQKGDTLWEIARRYQTTVPLLADLNNIENADLIYPGQKLLILRRTV